MKLAGYHLWLKEKGGAERVVLETARRSENHVTVYTLFYNEEKCFEELEDVKVKELFGFKPKGFVTKGAIFALGSIAAKIPEKHDKLLVSEAGLGSLITLRNKMPAVCYCHTPFRIFLPEFIEAYKKELNPALRPFFGIMQRLYNVLEMKAWGNFKNIIANSETTKSRISNKGLAEKQDIEVVNPGADLENKGEDYENYFFYPSRFRRYKRHNLAIEAFKEAELQDFKLVLAGSAQEEEYLEELRRKTTENIEIRTDVPKKEWNKLYANCYSVLFLAEKEEWGIIPIEAGSYSKPVIAVDEAGPSESVIDGETGFLANPNSREIAEKIQLLSENRQMVEEMGKKGKKESKKYSWESFVEKIDSSIFGPTKTL